MWYIYKIHWILVFHVWKEIQNKEEEEDYIILNVYRDKRFTQLLQYIREVWKYQMGYQKS